MRHPSNASLGFSTGNVTIIDNDVNQYNGTIFADTFTNHYDREIGMAAVELLEKAGITPSIRRPGCCARPPLADSPPDAVSTDSSRVMPLAACRRY